MHQVYQDTEYIVKGKSSYEKDDYYGRRGDWRYTFLVDGRYRTNQTIEVTEADFILHDVGDIYTESQRTGEETVVDYNLDETLLKSVWGDVKNDKQLNT